MTTTSDGYRAGRLCRILRSPLGWMLTGSAGIGAVAALTAMGPGPVPVLGAAVATVVYRVVMRRQARRETPEIAWRGATSAVLLGGALGVGFLAAAVLVIAACGGLSFSWAGNVPASVVGSAVASQIGGAVTEELMFRGLALQALEQWWGSRAALAVTGLFFGVAHLLNPGATVWSGLAIALEAGVMLGAAYLWRRSIWFVAGLHFGWNTVQQLLGIPVSGHASEGLFTADVHGADFLTGGGFGLEASIVPVIIALPLSALMVALARRRGTLLSARDTRTGPPAGADEQ
ncbi:CPBP family intramembrane glutamic endopeptidase [Nocardia aurantia]|uniref:CAAX prenyl protease 2/Lysostaphin resistance protein A-like domain-containing protein n=1 Tax=Nocardia aurantia TaxID=2585199 RepID=A0A7K0DM30_9NOCA|nr:CPBP family intramembrane glutamic endopeptidase [Nocardia aurantia]MQY26748.1 hypothetical protein [Nocardia aurantia]